MNVSVNSKGEAVESFLSGKLSQVDVRKIEAELAKLWTQASMSGSEDHPQVIRACSGNLILYTDRDDAETSDANMLDAVIISHPARAILAICRQAEPAKLEAWVSARCHLAPGSGTKQICSEQITVLAEGNLDNELVSVIESLLLGDLPVFLWWTASELSGEKLSPFLASISRLVVDSARAPYSFSYLRDLHKIVDSTEGCISVSDLNWRRLLGIRAALAEEFERLPFCLSSLDRICKIKVSACSQEFQEESCSIQALLFVGWLASRLGWDAVSLGKESGAEVIARFRKESEAIDVYFNSQVLTHVAPGSIFEVEIETTDEKKLRVSRDPAGEAGSLVLVVSEKGRKLRELIADDSDMDRVHLMGHELEDLGKDTVFAESLAAASELIRLLEDE